MNNNIAGTSAWRRFGNQRFSSAPQGKSDGKQWFGAAAKLLLLCVLNLISVQSFAETMPATQRAYTPVPVSCWMTTAIGGGSEACQQNPQHAFQTPLDSCKSYYTSGQGHQHHHMVRLGPDSYDCYAYLPSQPELPPIAFSRTSKRCPAGSEWWIPGSGPNYQGDDALCYTSTASYVCPAAGGWELKGTTCVRSAEPKNCGKPACELGKGNPINAGTGSKYEPELIYSGAGSNILNFDVNYSSRTAADPHTKPARRFGIFRFSAYENNLGLSFGPAAPVGAPGAVYASRPDGRFLQFALNGGSYVASADISYKLIRLVDGNGATTGWQLFNSDTDTIETYRANGGLTGLIHRDGRRLTMAYDSATGYMASVTDEFGRSIGLLPRDSAGRVTTLTQPDGKQVQFTFDAVNNNLKTITWPDAKVRTYHYEDSRFPNHLTGITDENGTRYATWAYDTQARAISSEHAGGADRTTLTFGANSTTVTDALGTARTINLTTILDVVRGTGSSQPGGSGCGPASSSQTYDANGNVSSRSDFNGNKTTYSYDLARNLETQRIEGLSATGAVRPETRYINTQWHSYWRLPVKIAEPKKLVSYVYNGDTYEGNVVTCAPATALVPSVSGGTRPIGVLCRRIEQSTADASGSQGFSAAVTGVPRISNWTYNDHGQVLTVDGPRTDATDVVTYTYHSATDADLGRRSNVATVTNALGHVTSIPAYDLNGRPLTVVDANGVTTSLAYDLRSRLVSRTVAGEITTYDYDGVGQLLKVTLPDASFLAYTYDPAHRLTRIEDSLGNRIDYTLDLLGNRTKEEVKDPAGQLARTRTRAYDALNRLWKDIGAQNQTTTYAYDPNGNLTGVTNPLGKLSTQQYDGLNRLVKSIDPMSGQTQFGYDGQDQLVQVTDPRNLVTSYTLDGLGNQTQLVSPDTGTSSSTVDAAGNVLTRTDAKGQVTTYQYDAANRLTRISYHDGSKELYTWDQGSNKGRLTQIEQKTPTDALRLTIQYAYDALGRKTQETRLFNGQTYTTQYRYANGRLSGLTYPSGRKVDYGFDAAGRIASVSLTDTGNQVTVLASNIQYHPFGGVKSLLNGAGQTLVFGEDLNGRPSSYSLANQTWQLGYDDASRIVGQMNTANVALSVSYGYDDLDRLTSQTLPNTSHGYAYDATGNRTSQTTGANTRTYTTSPSSNRLTQLTNPTQSYTYDANGSTITAGTLGYGYDTRGRLNSSTGALGTTSYHVDPLGQRIRKTNSTEDTLYHYDSGGRLIAEHSAAGNAKIDYLWLGDQSIAVVR